MSVVSLFVCVLYFIQTHLKLSWFGIPSHLPWETETGMGRAGPPVGTQGNARDPILSDQKILYTYNFSVFFFFIFLIPVRAKGINSSKFHILRHLLGHCVTACM